MSPRGAGPGGGARRPSRSSATPEGEEAASPTTPNGGSRDAYDLFNEGGIITAGVPAAPPSRAPRMQFGSI